MISIGLPAIKPQFLAEAIRSVLDQQFTDFELIVFNDRMDSGIRNIVKSFDDPRVVYAEGTGVLPVVENWNKVLSLAKGEYFVLFSDDDRYDPVFLAEMNNLLTIHPHCQIVHCRVRKTNVRGEVTAFTSICPEFESGLDFILNRLRGGREQFAPEFLVRTEKLLSIGGFADLPLAWGSDDLTWFTLALESGIAYNPRPLVDWRQSPFQISQSGDIEERMAAVEKQELLLTALIREVDPLNDADRMKLLQIKNLFKRYFPAQKAHLVAVHARNTSIAGLTRFYLKNRKRFRLEFQWLLYALYIKLYQGIIKN